MFKLNLFQDVSGCNEEAKHCKSHFLSQAALGFVTSITSILFGSIVSTLLGAYRSILKMNKLLVDSVRMKY